MLMLPSAWRTTLAFRPSMVTVSAWTSPFSSGSSATLTCADVRLAASCSGLLGSDSRTTGSVTPTWGKIDSFRSPSNERVRL